MPRQDNWVPKTADERLDRLESLDEIRQLAHRYALAVDTRNLDDLVELFVEDVQVGRDKRGREAMKTWFGDTLSRFADSIHFVGNHVIDFDSSTTARGVVYCRDELEKGGEWHVGTIQYWDAYERRGGRWYFKRRKLHRWYMVDALQRPAHGGGLAGDQALTVAQIPDAWPSWGKFWQARGRPPR
jgi:hypothetical protein